MRKVLSSVGATLLFVGPALAADLLKDTNKRATLILETQWRAMERLSFQAIGPRLEEFFAKTMGTFGLSKEELKAKADFNFGVYDMKGFESVRGVFRLANALSENGFTQFAFLKGKGLADLKAVKDAQEWLIEVKTLVLQTKPHEFKTNGPIAVLPVDKFQPENNRIEDYVEKVSMQIAGNLVEKARQQLIDTVKKEGEALLKKMKSWDEDMVQRKSKAYDDVENFPNKFTANYLFLINQSESDIPRVNQPSLDRLKQLNMEWATLKARANEILNKDVPSLNKRLWEVGLGAIWKD